MKYRKKPIVIEAVRWTGSITPEVEDLLGEAKVLPKGSSLLIPTLEGVMEARRGDYIIRGVNGELYPCKPDIFKKTYEILETGMKPVTVFSAFDGAGIGLLALKRAGVPIAAYYASEVDKYAMQVAKKNHPEIIHVGDVKQCYARNFPKIDLLIGGSPCQDLSIAKAKREGLKGARSGLFWHYVRLLRTMKPRYFLLENVASMSKEDKAKITEIMGVEPILINSALVSAQQRKRLYWTNIQGVTQPADKGILLKDVLETGISPRDKAYCLDANYWKTIGKNALENARARRQLVFQPVIYNPFNRIVKNDKANALGTRCDHLFSRTGQVVASPAKLGFVCGKDYQQNRVYSIKGKSVSLNGNGGGWGANTGLYKIDLPDGDYTIRKLTPTECERLQTWPDGYTEGVSNTQRYKIIGNGWTADVIAHIFKFMKEALCEVHH